mgnify:CR=1 FL=1
MKERRKRGAELADVDDDLSERALENRGCEVEESSPVADPFEPVCRPRSSS